MLRDDLARIRQEPSLLLIEVAWRWMFGISALVLLAFAFVRLQRAIVITPEEESLLASFSPLNMAQALVTIGQRALPIAARSAAIVIPALLMLWVIAATWGRAIVLSRLVEAEDLSWTGLIGLHALRALSLVGLAAGYVASSMIAAFFANPENPNYFLSVLVFLPVFAGVVLLWMWIHWVLSLAAIFTVSEKTGVFGAIRSALHLVRGEGKSLEGIAFANGAARTVIALLFTVLGLLPLPFYRVAPGFFIAAEVLAALAYCIVSDFILLGRLSGYVKVATRGGESL